ncbi:DNA-binding transcriptional ArsR family regulator [Nakamurella sp. UYEF19]|uniref:ArsR/SmtB family transcription factor n=1 Tax=Nakamurella sp. UYEF19 TaxID=1756392 RepID=UPI00339445FF
MSRDFTGIGRALAALARSKILDLLMDGSARPAGELSAAAGVGASATSEHLAVLLEAGLLSCVITGRQRFYRIATPSIAAAVEHIGRLCPELPVSSLRLSRAQRDLAQARLCYDHLAGRVAVLLTDSYLDRRWLETESLALTEAGERGFLELGVDIAALRAGRRQLCRSCPDWTERRPHLAGSLGAAVAELFQQRAWAHRRGSGRGLIITDIGVVALEKQLGVHLPA